MKAQGRDGMAGKLPRAHPMIGGATGRCRWQPRPSARPFAAPRGQGCVRGRGNSRITPRRRYALREMSTTHPDVRYLLYLFANNSLIPREETWRKRSSSGSRATPERCGHARCGSPASSAAASTPSSSILAGHHAIARTAISTSIAGDARTTATRLPSACADSAKPVAPANPLRHAAPAHATRANPPTLRSRKAKAMTCDDEDKPADAGTAAGLSRCPTHDWDGCWSPTPAGTGTPGRPGRACSCLVLGRSPRCPSPACAAGRSSG